MKRRKPRRTKPMGKADWDMVVAKYPPGLYAVYTHCGEEEAYVRGYMETECGVGLILTNPMDHSVVRRLCLGCNTGWRVELIRALE